jgi:small subunit ribosomal protein S6
MKDQQPLLYEGMFVINAHLTDDARNKAFDKVKNAITSRGGEIVKIHDQGRRRLAYEIQKQKDGHYYLLYFRSAPQKLQELWQEYHLNEDLLRFLTLRTDTVMEELTFKQLQET